MTTAPAMALPATLERSSTVPAIHICSLSKRFSEPRGWRKAARHPFRRTWVTALQDVDLEVARGEFFGLLGPNGAGKTTLFKVLSTLVEPDGGDVLVHGRRVTEDAAHVRRLVTPVIADERSLRWRLSARENLLLYAHLYGVSPPRISKRIDHLLDVVGLADTGTRMVGAFSTGMRQRLAIARALLAEPDVLLLDEPTRSLDPLAAKSLRTFLREEVATRRGTTILLATHLAEEAFDLCDRVGVLHKGRLLACGTTEQLAREFADQPYLIWTTVPNHPALHGAREVTGSHGTGDWRAVEITLSSEEQAATKLKQLMAAGVPIARFEKASLQLADLIERVVQRGSTS
jgi:ABC-2 type transport system ATP-binding protein